MVMDPFTAVSIAGSMVQFVDFGIKVVSKGNQIYRSADGLLAENHDLEIVTNDLLVLQTKLKRSLRPQQSTERVTDDKQGTENLMNACSELAGKLLGCLNMVKAQGRYRRWKSFRQALKSVCSKGEIEHMARRLAMLRDELQMNILVSLREKLDVVAILKSEKYKLLDQSAKTILEAIQENRNVFSKDITAHTESLARRHDHSDTLLIQTSSNIIAVIERHAQKREAEEKRRGIEGRQVKRETPSDYWAVQDAILRSLAFPMMENRHESVAEAHAKTFAWILDDSSTNKPSRDNFAQWLRHGDDVYWINGKAASGKSTLMKFLFKEYGVQEKLRLWAGRKRLVCAKFFFWSTGTQMQKSQIGLFRSLLHQAFSQHPQLISAVLPRLWETAARQPDKLLWSLGESWCSWPLSELKQVFHKLVNQTTSPIKFCFFIDGLDEFDGDHAELAALFKHVASSESAKVCVSSRPLMVFDHEFDQCAKLRLQDLTVGDIKLYVNDKLRENKRYLEIAKQEPGLARQLVAEIVETSSGVFLWVTLVVRSLLKGLTNFDRTCDLQKRLRELPPELDDLYSLMLGSIEPPFYVEQASRLLQIVYHSRSPISALALSFADEENVNFALEAKLDPIHQTEISYRVREMTGRLKSRCAGLLEVTTGPDSTPYVQYLHLTVKEFLEKPDVWSTLLRRTARKGFDASVSLLRSLILQLKTADSGLEWDEPTWHLIELSAEYALQAENSTGEAQVALLDELDRVAHYRFAKTGRFATHWSAAMHSIDQRCYTCPDSFLAYSITSGLTLYVKAKIGHRFSSVNNQMRRPLLQYATFYRPIYSKANAVHPSMVAFLFQEGADPNQRCKGSTHWRNVLDNLYNKSEEFEKTLESSWIDVCKLFVIYGANPNAYCKRVAENKCFSALEVIEAAFSHLPPGPVDELRTMLIQRGAHTWSDAKESGSKRGRTSLQEHQESARFRNRNIAYPDPDHEQARRYSMESYEQSSVRETQMERETPTQKRTATETETQTKTKTWMQVETEMETKTQMQVETETETETQTQMETEMETKIETQM